MPVRLNFIVYSDSTAEVRQAFVLDTGRLTGDALAGAGLRRADRAASDHLPVVVDIAPAE